MRTTTTPQTDPWPLVAYFVLAYAVSWSIAIPLALAHQGLIDPMLPPWTHYLVAFGPMLAAFIVTAVSQGAPGLRALGKRMLQFRACPKWWIVSFSPLILGFLAIWILNGLTGSRLGVATLGAVDYLPPLGFGALLLWILTFGVGGETGWRGFALPRLQTGRSALTATLILAGLWALWYLPLFFYVFDPANAIVWVIGLFAGSVILTWLHNSAKDSIFFVSICLGCFYFMTASTADLGGLPLVLVAFAVIAAAVVIAIYKPKYLISL